MISDRCYHVPTAPGQGVCTCVDQLMWTRLLVELQARRIVELERDAQSGRPALFSHKRLGIIKTVARSSRATPTIRGSTTLHHAHDGR